MTAPTSIGRYQILQSVGVGGMGSLYLARDPKIGNRRVVIKLLREGFDNPELRERFAREADAAGGLHHINVVTIFDVGDYDGQPFIAMEYIQGETLTDLIRRGAKMSLARKIQLMEELCAGLHYAHRAGIVHRDIKPANVMVDEDGVLKILDFGIARLGGSGMTQAGMVMGTLNYMAPEQMAGQPVDARADMFSAGAVFYELLSSRRAFPGELPGIVHKIMTATREPLASVAPELDPALVAIVDRCLAREPGDRYSDMAAARRELHTRIEDARAAVARADFVAALQACEQALTIDSDYTPALELQRQAQAALGEQQVREWLAAARNELEQGALTAAGLLVDRALSVTSASSEAAEVREAIEAARERIQEEHAREKAIAKLLDRARDALDAGSLEAAAKGVNEALALHGGHAEALALQQDIAAAETRRKAEQEARERAELDARARAVVADARRVFGANDHAGALRMLEAFNPAHPIIDAALTELRIEAKEMERRRLEAERRRQEQLRQEQEQQRKAREDEERRQAAAAAEARRLEDQRQQLAREEAERRRAAELAEQRRREEERRRTEEEHQRDQSRGRQEAAARYVADATLHMPPGSAQEAALKGQTVVIPKVAPPPPIHAPNPGQSIPQAGHARPANAPDLPLSTRQSALTVTSLLQGRLPLVGAAALIIVLIVGLMTWRSRTGEVEPGAAVAQGSVVLDIAPWAKIDKITRKNDGRAVDAGTDLVTPCVLTLPAGEYRIVASNPSFVQLEFDLTVESGNSPRVRQTMPGFDPQKEVTDIVGQ